MEQMLEYVKNIDWLRCGYRVIYSIPIALLVVLSCIAVFKLYDNVGKKKIDYVYASEEEKEMLSDQRRTARARVLVCVFWIVLVLLYVMQCLIDYTVIDGGL